MQKKVVIFILLIIFSTGHVMYSQVDYRKDSVEIESFLIKSDSLAYINPVLALTYSKQYLKLVVQAKNKSREGAAYDNLARVNYTMGNYEMALNYFSKSLSIYEALNQEVNMMVLANNMAVIYLENKEYDKALAYFEKSMKQAKALNRVVDIYNTMANVGLAHEGRGEHMDAYINFSEAVDLIIEHGDRDPLFFAYNNIGDNYIHRGVYDSALFYFEASKRIGEGIRDYYAKARLFNSMGLAYLHINEIDSAEKYYTKALFLGESVHSKLRLKESYLGLSKALERKGAYKQALAYLQKHNSAKDSLLNQEKLVTSKIGIMDLNNKNKEHNQQQSRARRIINKLKSSQAILIASLSVVSLFLFITLGLVIYSRKKLREFSNKALTEKNIEIQKKNDSIMDSISYAKSIQDSFLSTPDVLNDYFTDYFLYTRARDVINGDFPWFYDNGDYIIFAIVDCTGHGVPGAMMTVLGNFSLNQIIIEKAIHAPAKILAALNTEVRKTFSHENNTDGMDVAIGRYDKGSMKLTYAGAKRPLYYFTNNELREIKGDNFSIGGIFQSKEKTYKEHEIYLNKDDTVYLFSDGYIDQFGGKNDKKFLAKRLKDKISEIQGQPMHLQKEILDKTIREWKGGNEQTDDILIMGMLV